MEDKLIVASETALVTELIADFQRCTPWTDGWNRTSDNENVRFNRWPGQSTDGKKHDTATTKAFPFDGASDTRVPLADEVINENVAVCCVSFWRAMIQPKFGQREGSDYAVKLADYFVNTVLKEELVRELELSEQYRQMTGWVVLHPRWSREVCLEHRLIKMEELVAMAQNAKQQLAQMQAAAAAQGASAPAMGLDTLAMLPQLVKDPVLEDQAVEVLRKLYSAFAQEQVKQINVELPELREAKVRKAVRELREEGQADLPVPYVSKNQPEIFALKPWDEIFVPNDATDIQEGPRVYRRVWMTEPEMRAKILTDGWSAKWVTEALKHKGKYSVFTGTTVTSGEPPIRLGEPTAGVQASMFMTQSMPFENKVEVIYATYRALDEDNVPAVFLTVFNVHVSQDEKGKVLVAEHGLLEGAHGQMPYVAGMRENWSRQITSSRGVPQVAAAWQREKKVQRDGLIDHTSIGVTPPVLVPKGAMGVELKFGPAVQNEVTPGREPKWMEVPHGGVGLGMELHEVVNAEVDNYFGRLAADVPPTRAQTKQAMLVMGFLGMWANALQKAVNLAQVHMSDAEFAEITGAPAGWLDGNRYNRSALVVELQFDVRELDPEYMQKQLETVNQTVIPGDVAGVIDRAKYTKVQLRSINPALARELVADTAAASQQIFKDVQNQIALMALGNEPEYVEMDPTASTKLQFGSQIVGSNPNYQQMLKGGGRFAELLQKWAMNLQFSITQEQNKKVGRIGVNPEGMESNQ